MHFRRDVFLPYKKISTSLTSIRLFIYVYSQEEHGFYLFLIKGNKHGTNMDTHRKDAISDILFDMLKIYMSMDMRVQDEPVQ